MGLFKNLMNKIFHAGANAEAPPDAIRAGQTPVSRVQVAAATGVPLNPSAPASPQPGVATQPVDVAAILDGMAAKNSQKLDWRHSIVDLMKLLDMDSSLAERKELATDLKYPGDMSDSAAMNMWLHKEVMRKLAENGGKVPADLLAH